VLSVTEEAELMIITEQGKIARLDSSQIRECGRSTQGVRLIGVEEGGQVAAVCLVRSEANGNGNGSSAQPSLIQ
jgi:DNA gyrase subunit A